MNKDIFFVSNLTVSAINRALDLAMVKAGYGILPIKVVSVTDSSDGYADYTGFNVEVNNLIVDENIQKRAHTWLVAYLKRYIPEWRKISNSQASIYEIKEDGSVMCFRWSLGD